MNVIRCRNGHFFDSDSYGTCPHCGEIANITKVEQPKEEKKGFWARTRKDKAASAQQINSNATLDCENFVNGNDTTDVIEINKDSNNKQNASNSQLEKNPTLDFWQTSSNYNSNSDDIYDISNESNSTKEVNIKSTDIATDESSNEKRNTYTKEQGKQNEVSTSLREVVKNASASNEGKTMSYFNSATSASSSQSSVKCINEPVVGWLVCVFGEHFGECFSIYAGKNSIGRSTDNRIVIPNDNSISRVKHALIVYEPKKRNFYLQPGDSSGLTYLNDDYITDSKKLNLYDSIELGESKFIFISLCGENFSWEDYMPKGE